MKPILILSLPLLAGCCPFCKDDKQAHVTTPPPAAFEIISGPEEIGWSRHWVVRHRGTGARFIYTERSGSAIAVTALP